jgi:hypothetical protein
VGNKDGRNTHPPNPTWRREFGLDRALLELAALAFGKAAPDAKALVIHQCIFEALVAYVAGQADLLCIACRTTLFREKCLRISLSTKGTILPTSFVTFGLEEMELPHSDHPSDPWLREGVPGKAETAISPTPVQRLNLNYMPVTPSKSSPISDQFGQTAQSEPAPPLG